MSFLPSFKVGIGILCASLSTIALADTNPSSDKTILNSKKADEAYDQLLKQEVLNAKMRHDFIVFMKYKEAICSSKMDASNKKINLISFDYTNRKNTIEFEDGLNNSHHYLFTIISEDEIAQERILPKNARDQIKPLFEIAMFVHDYLEEFDNCSKKYDVNSKNFSDYYMKMDTKGESVGALYFRKKIKSME